MAVINLCLICGIAWMIAMGWARHKDAQGNRITNGGRKQVLLMYSVQAAPAAYWQIIYLSVLRPAECIPDWVTVSLNATLLWCTLWVAMGFFGVRLFKNKNA